MDDLISRQAAIAYAISGLTREFEGEKWIRVSEVRESLQTMPSAEQHGWWIETLLGWRCSVCGEEQDYSVYFKHCPNCGAKMDGEEK